MSLINSLDMTSERVRDIKTVKNASIYITNDVIFCKHYNTIIFAYDQKNKVCEIMKDCSRTSNRQIQYLLNSLSLTWDDCININQKTKWSYSDSLFR